MFLTVSNLAHYLIGRGLLSAKTVVDGDFVAVEAGRRNRNYKVLVRSGTSLFLKQIKSQDAAAISTLQREAACYRMAQNTPSYQPMAQAMSRMVDHDAARHCLILEMLPAAENLTEYAARTNSFPVEIGKLLGRQLAACHGAVRERALYADELAVFPRLPPWILSYHNSAATMPPDLSGGAIRVGHILRQYPDMCASLDRLRREWRYDSLIHGDMKWDNCLVYTDTSGARSLKIIDWELVDYGDACWDIGSVFQSYLTSWIFSMPLMQEHAPERLMAKAAFPLDAMAPSIGAFWRSYVESAAIPPWSASQRLIRSIEYGAARLVQTAYESLYMSHAMTNHGAALLQVAQNILRDPAGAADSLLGLKQEMAA